MLENVALIINALPIPVFIQDLDGKYIECNNRFAMYLNKSKSEIIGKYVSEVIINKELTAKASKLNDLLLKKAELEKGQYSWAGNTLTDSYKDFTVHKSMLRDSNGNIIGILGSIIDTSNEQIFDKEIHRTKEVISKKGLDHEALKLLNHEFRTPMNAIKGLTEILFQKEDDIERKNFLYKIKTSTDRLLKLIINVLQLAEIESDEFELKYYYINIDELIKNTIRNFEGKASDKGLNLFYSEDNSIPDKILTSRFAITAIVSNLVSNAIKFSFKGDIIILLRKIIEKNNQIWIELSVEDEGIGIAENEKEKIFEKFVQAHELSEDIYTGAGLGLHIVEQIVESLDGKINVESEIGKGSTFTVVFPVNL